MSNEHFPKISLLTSKVTKQIEQSKFSLDKEFTPQPRRSSVQFDDHKTK